MNNKAWWGVLALCVSVGSMAAGPTRPNIVVLVADDWGFTDVGAFGGEIATPNIDALAQNGMRFANFHVAASCAPTRSMLMTGVDNHRNGVGNLREAMPTEHEGQPGYLGSLNTHVVTVSSLLQDSGYHTYITGKWNVGSEPYNLPDKRGYERSIIQGDTGSDNWEPAKRYLPHSAKVEWFEDGKEANMPAEYYSSQYFVDRMIGYLKSGQDGKPFFAYVGFQANHVPLQAPPEFIAKYKGRYQNGWTALREERRNKAAALGLIPKDTPMVTMQTTANWDALSDAEKAYEQRRMEVYAGMADAMDFHVGRLIAYLKQSGQYDNTVFVFLSDNGAEASDYHEARLWLKTQYTQDIDKLGGKGAYGIMGPSWASAAASPLYTYKFYAGEGGIRTPLIISGVPGMPRNRVQTSLTHVTDIVPTLLDLAQVPAPGNRYHGQLVEPIAGSSLVAVLKGEAAQAHPPTQAIGYELSGNLALFKGDLKLVKNLPPVGDGQWHLYNLHTDPGETHDLRELQPRDFQTLQLDYELYARTHGVLPMPEGYSPSRQVLINSIRHYWLPTYGLKAGVLLLGLLALATAWVLRRRKRRAQ